MYHLVEMFVEMEGWLDDYQTLTLLHIFPPDPYKQQDDDNYDVILPIKWSCDKHMVNLKQYTLMSSSSNWCIDKVFKPLASASYSTNDNYITNKRYYIRKHQSNYHWP